MLLNYGLSQKAPNIVSAPKSNVDVNAMLGLSPSQYSGFQTVGDTGYFMKDSKLYQPYTPSGRSFVRQGPYGLQTYNGTNNAFGTYTAPQPAPYWAGGGYLGGWSPSGGPVEGTIYSGSQAFKPITDVDLKGFNYNADEGTYDPSMAYVYANTPKPTFNPTPNVTSFLSAPTAMNTPTGNYGAGRYLGNTGLLGGLDFGLPSGQSANTSGTP